MAEEERPKMEKIADGKIRKKSFGRKLSEVFISEDPKVVGKTVFEEHIVPSFLNLIVDAFESAVEMLLLGKLNARRTKGSNGVIVAYDAISSNRHKQITRSPNKSVYDVMDVVFEDRGKASFVLDTLIEYVDRYDRATVHDFYDACGVTAPEDTNYNDTYYGWKDLRGATINKVREGWAISMPEPQQLK